MLCVFRWKQGHNSSGIHTALHQYSRLKPLQHSHFWAKPVTPRNAWFWCECWCIALRRSQSHDEMLRRGDSITQFNSRANRANLVEIRCHFARVVSVLHHFHRITTEQPEKGFFRRSECRAGSGTDLIKPPVGLHPAADRPPDCENRRLSCLRSPCVAANSRRSLVNRANS